MKENKEKKIKNCDEISKLIKAFPKDIAAQRKVHGKLNASWKISSLAVNGQSFLVIDGYL